VTAHLVSEAIATLITLGTIVITRILVAEFVLFRGAVNPIVVVVTVAPITQVCIRKIKKHSLKRAIVLTMKISGSS